MGDHVAWTLLLMEDNERYWGWPQEMLVELRVLARRRAESEGASGAIVVSTSEGPEIAVRESGAGDGDVVGGSLIEEHHGGVPAGLKEVKGTVRRLRLVSQRFRLADRALIPVPGAVRFREVDRMPDAFAAPDPHEDAPEQWREIGALAELELA